MEVARYAAHGEMGGVFPPARRGRGDRLPTATAANGRRTLRHFEKPSERLINRTRLFVRLQVNSKISQLLLSIVPLKVLVLYLSRCRSRLTFNFTTQ